MPSPTGSPGSSSRPDHESLYISSAEPASQCSETGKEVQTTPALLEVRRLCRAAVVAGALLRFCRWHSQADMSAPAVLA